MQAQLSRIKSILPILTKFASGQLALQLLNTLNGFFLLRWLSLEQQALFSVAFSVQILLTSLSDMGFSGSIVALVSNKYDDHLVIKKYVHSAKRLRNLFFFIGVAVCAVLYPLLMKKQTWNGYIFWINMLPVVAASYWQANVSIYSAPLMIHKKMKALYLPQIVSSGFRLIVNFTLYIFGLISSFTTLSVNAIVLLFNSIAFRKKGIDYNLDANLDDEDTDARRQMLKYLSPLLPGLLFNSIYGQLQVFIIAYFGKSNSIAEIAALGRLSQFFLLLSAFNGVLIGPYIAKSTSASLPKKYFSVLLLALVVAVVLILSAKVCPWFYLFILGEKYHHLESELVLIIATAAVNFMGGVFWVMNAARQWLFWWGTWVYIIGTILCQVIGIHYLDVSSTHGVLQLSLITSVFMIGLYLVASWYGFRKENVSIYLLFKRMFRA